VSAKAAYSIETRFSQKVAFFLFSFFFFLFTFSFLPFTLGSAEWNLHWIYMVINENTQILNENAFIHPNGCTFILLRAKPSQGFVAFKDVIP